MIRKESVTCTSDAYASGDVIQGVITLPNIIRPGRNNPILQNIVVQDTSTACPTIDFYVLDADVSSDTTITDNAIIALADADLPKVIGIVQVSTFYQNDANSFGQAANVAMPVFASNPASGVSTDNDIYVIPVARGASVADWGSLSFVFSFVD